VITLCPFVDGLRRALATKPAVSAWLIPQAAADLAGRRRLVPVTAQPGEKAAMALAGEADGFARAVPAGSPWRNEITPGIFLTVAAFRPVTKARRLAMPLWVGRGDHDITTSAKAIARLATRSSKGELHDYPSDHFDVLVAPLAGQVANDMVTFLRSNHLTG
jgi:pimeloyl-ACP methyl ester carboxylesterase